MHTQCWAPAASCTMRMVSLSTACGSESGAGEEGGEDEGRGGGVETIYRGPLGRPIRAVKVFSVSSAVITAIGSPALALLASEHLPIGAGVAMATGAVSISLFTTSLLYWFTKPYVVSLGIDPKDQDLLHITTLSLLGRPAKSIVHVDDVSKELKRPFASFHVPSSGSHYFLHAGVGDIDRYGHILARLADKTAEQHSASEEAARVQAEIDAIPHNGTSYTGAHSGIDGSKPKQSSSSSSSS